jgi:hypothetical protein
MKMLLSFLLPAIQRTILEIYIYEEGIIIGVIEACVLANLDLHDSSVTGIRNATFKLGIGGSRQPTKRERIECGINRLKKVK